MCVKVLLFIIYYDIYVIMALPQAQLHHFEHPPIIPIQYLDPEISLEEDDATLPTAPLEWLLEQPGAIVTTLDTVVRVSSFEGTRYRHILNPPESGLLKPTDEGAQYDAQNNLKIDVGLPETCSALILAFACIDRGGAHYRCPIAVTTDGTLDSAETLARIVPLGEFNKQQQASAAAQRVLPGIRLRPRAH
jgi:hypothetical protein